MNRQINHKVMRVIVGFIAILISPTVLLLSGRCNELTSISISYWTDSHDIFVGSLFAVGFFLSAYNGEGKKMDWEYLLSKMACVFAICVALFPTKGFSSSDIPAKWVSAITETIHIQSTYIHYGSAILLFFCLIAMMFSFSNRAKKNGEPRRAYIYRIGSVVMVVGIIVLFVYGQITNWSKMILFIETWGLTLFGGGWFYAGAYKTKKQPDKA